MISPTYLRHINTLLLPGSRSCGMKCRYCYAGYNSMKTSPEPGISRELIDKSMVFLTDYLRPLYRPALVIGFGGDPIEAWDFYVYAQEKCKSDPKYSQIQVMISTTHGQNLTQKHLDYLAANGGSISFSIDGSPSTYRKLRKSRSATVDPFNRVLRSYQLAKKSIYCSVNSTITPNGSLVDDLLYLYEMGFRTITMLPVRPNETTDFTFDTAFKVSIEEQYVALMRAFRSWPDEQLLGVLKSLTSADYLMKLFYKIVLDQPLHRKCGAGFNFLYVSGGGDITACPSFRPYLNPKSILGSLDAGIDLAMLEPYFNFSTHLNEPCKSCEVAAECGGHCFYNSLNYKDDINVPYELDCSLTKTLVRELHEFHQYLKAARPHLLQDYRAHLISSASNEASYFSDAGRMKTLENSTHA